jgi:hypothetical protein
MEQVATIRHASQMAAEESVREMSALGWEASMSCVREEWVVTARRVDGDGDEYLIADLEAFPSHETSS